MAFFNKTSSSAPEATARIGSRSFGEGCSPDWGNVKNRQHHAHDRVSEAFA